MINRKALLAVGASAALAALWPSGTFAADHQPFPPSPSQPNCHGVVLGVGNSTGHNIAAASRASGMSVQELQILVRTKVCA